MGICLDTEHSDGSQAFEEGTESWVENSPRQSRNAVTPMAGKFPMHNDGHVQFESPKVPVIFVLGGPGSGKVTHCDNLMQEKREVVHINMSDLLQQYAIGNDGYTSLINVRSRYKSDIPDYGQLSSRTVTEVLMVEMKMAPNAKTYLVSGYPRNMRDVVEYAEKIRVINGVMLISWRQKVLERQIDYGAKLGQVVLSLAKMELNNFYKNVIPVAEYFSQAKMLIKIHGERPPMEVYQDFRAAFFQILSNQDNPPEFTANNNMVAPLPTDLAAELPTLQNHIAEPSRPKTQVISVGNQNGVPNFKSPIKPLAYPPVLWVIGGPGSNKAALCAEIAQETGWTHVSLGKQLRAACEAPKDTAGDGELTTMKDSISNGDLVSKETIMKFIDSQMNLNLDSKGIILDGFPRNMEQANEFENRYKQKPTIILLDCSKLQLGKGRLDDSVTAFRRRLEVFRESSLPMLKTMDNVGRLTIVDGDTDTTPVKEDFENVVKSHIEYMLSNNTANGHVKTGNGHIPNGHLNNNNKINGHLPNNGEATMVDLEVSSPINTISKQVGNGTVAVANGGLTRHQNFVATEMEGHI